jgi:Protein of unknown function (DUF3443)
MRRVARMVAAALIGLWSLSFVSCGGGGGGLSSAPGGTTAATNEVAVIVDSGPDPAQNPTENTLYTTVTMCVPGSTTECQTIDHIQVDTGSEGLRILGPVLTLSLPAVQATDGNSLVECTQFVGAYSWGSIASADVQVAGEKASSVPVQVIGTSAFTVPTACANIGTPEDTVATFGANGILGIGVFAQDCGANCAPPNDGNTVYYSCTTAAAACTGIAAPLTAQVLNPVPLFPADNNGSIIVLPAVAAAGAATVSGSLIFGIDTESNNASGSVTVLALDGIGDFVTTLGTQSLSESFLDSGSNGFFFYDPDYQNVLCGTGFANFYCPGSPQTLTATLTGAGAAPATTSVTFTFDNAQTVFTDNPTFAAFPTVAGTYGSNLSFDWGLPFFFNRRVATAIEGKTTAVATGPYVAF